MKFFSPQRRTNLIFFVDIARLFGGKIFYKGSKKAVHHFEHKIQVYQRHFAVKIFANGLNREYHQDKINYQFFKYLFSPSLTVAFIATTQLSAVNEN